MFRNLLFTLAMIINVQQLFSINLYWKGNTSGDYNDPNMWWVGSFNSGLTAAQSPISNDNVFFSSAAFNAPGQIVNITSNASCNNMYWDPSIAAANQPSLRCTNSTVNLDIHGDLTLCSNLNWLFSGNLRFKSFQSAGTLHYITTAGKRLLVNSMVFECNNLVEYILMDNLHVDDPSQSVANLTQGGIILNGGYLNTNKKSIRADNFISNNNNRNRRLSIDSSRITLTRYHDQYAWDVDFNAIAATPNFSGFSSRGSHIIQNGYYYTWMRFGTGIKYDSISFDTEFASPIGDYNASVYINTRGNNRDTFEHVFAKRQVVLVNDNTTMIIKNLHVYPQTILSAHSSAKTLEIENIINYSNCNQFPIIGSNAKNGWVDNLTIRKISPGTLVMNNLILSRVTADITGGRLYVANNSIGKGNIVNITINSGTGRELYFRAIAGNQDWHNINNWREFSGGSFNPASCLPTPFDNVFFDAASFNSNNRVEYTQRAYCKDMTWLSSIPTSARLSGGNLLQVFGDLRYDSKMTFGAISGVGGNYRAILLCGRGPDTVITNAAVNNTISVILDNFSDYRIIGNYSGLITCGDFSRLRMAADTLRPSADFAICYGNLDGTQIYINTGSWAFYMRDHGATAINYTGNATIHWTQPVNLSGYSVYGGYLPNLIVYGGMKSNYSNLYIRGNLTLKQDALMVMGNTQYGGNVAAALRVIGGLNGANGDVVMEEGSSLVFSSFGGTGSRLEVAGNFTANGSCRKNISILTHDGNPLNGGFRVNGAVNISFANILGMPNVSPAPNTNINVANSTNSGNNSGWTFNTGSSQTFYWRARRGNPTLYTGNWSDPGHWTTLQSNTMGDSLCVPSPIDDVVFDNLSFSATSNGCTVAASARCRDILFSDAARLSIGNADLHCRNFVFNNALARWDGNLGSDISPSRIFISGNLTLAPNMTSLLFRGDIHMNGSGDIRSNGSKLQARAMIFNKSAGVWNLLDDLYLDNDWAGTNTTNRRAGELRFFNGTINSNNFNITISSYFNSNSTNARTLNLGSSTITVRSTAWYYIYWNARVWDLNATNFTFNSSPNAQIIFMPNVTFNSSLTNTKLDYYMGNGLNYPKVSIADSDQAVSLFGASNYNFLQLEANAYIDANNTMDSLRLEGGYFYRFRNGSTQTLRAPHGHIISNGTSSAFVNIESSSPGNNFSIRKPFGPAFCIDFVKVKDCVGTKETNLTLIPTSPVNYQNLQPFLEFQTGLNSDNIGGSATGIWAFSLPVLVTPQYAGSNVIIPCGISAPPSFTIPVTGTGPYYVNYTWTSASGNGSNVVTAPDDDNNSSTPAMVTIPINSTSSSITYTFNITTFRCAEETTPISRSAIVNQLAPNILTQTAQTAECDFTNSSVWLTLFGNLDDRPVVSIQDSTAANDQSALGRVNTEIFFDPTVQQVNIGGIMYPYLQRHWEIVPTNNGPANVRIYFTQAELNALISASVNTFTPLTSATQLQVVRYASGTIGVGPEQIIPHTIRLLSGAAAAPFSSTTNVYAFEFSVPSFSHFIITPTQSVILDLNLLHFTAEKQQNNKVLLNWTVENSINTELYEIERSEDGISAYTIGSRNSNLLNSADSYQFLDEQAKSGLNYYRIRSTELDGTHNYSDWRVVEFGENQNVKIIPNPAYDLISIETDNEGPIEIRITNQLGQIIDNRSFDNSAQMKNLDISHLPNGIYTIQIFFQNNGAVSTKQFVKK